MEIEIKLILELGDGPAMNWIPETVHLTHWRSIAMLPLLVSELIDMPPAIYDHWLQSHFQRGPQVN